MVPRPIGCPVLVSRAALVRLADRDPRMAALIRRVGPFRLRKGRAGSAFAALVRAIVYQQLSAQAAAVIFERFRALFDADRFPDPAAILSARPEALRTAGLSRQKIASLHDLCARVVAGDLVLAGIERSSDEQIVERLTRVRGIGRWSAQMFLIFDLGRLDVWPETDLGIRKALKGLYGLRSLPGDRAAAEMGARFAPTRTVASWYLWRSIDADPGDW